MANHSYRFHLITSFVRDHFEQLVDDDLARTTIHGEREGRKELYQALCELPYSVPVTQGKSTTYKFSYDEVRDRALALMEGTSDGEAP